ncbi:hypothetical protein JJD41_16215 [Oxynema sp. CENA135]|nr:hypothetical protein [Oxynema sp. CENA135]
MKLPIATPSGFDFLVLSVILAFYGSVDGSVDGQRAISFPGSPYFFGDGFKLVGEFGYSAL